MKRRRVTRKRHFDDGWVRESGSNPMSLVPPAERSAIFEHFTGTEWRNTTQLAALEISVETT